MKMTLLTFMMPLIASAHGEDMAGPHGGHIQMPASFHTEVVAKEDQTFHIYLTDMDFKNPTTQKSEVKATHTMGAKKVDLKCRIRKDHFICQGTQKMNSGALILQATRDGVAATSQAEYTLPLKPFKTEDHSNH